MAVYILAGQTVRDLVLFEDNALPAVGEHQLVADIALAAPAEHVNKSIRLGIEGSV